MSYLLDEIIMLPLVEEKLGDMPAHQQAYLKIAFDELVEHPTLCNTYAGGWLDTGLHLVEVFEVSVGYASFTLAFALGKGFVILDVRVNSNIFPPNAAICV